MAIAINFVQYNNAPPFASPQEVPLLDWGTQAGGTSQRQALGLRFQGGSVQNLKMWVDGDSVDLYPSGQPAALHQGFSAGGFSVQAVRIDSTSPGTYDESIAVYEHSDLSGWTPLGTSEASALPLGNATLGPAMDTYSDVFGLALTVPAVTVPTVATNFRLMASFDTDDDTLLP